MADVPGYPHARTSEWSLPQAARNDQASDDAKERTMSLIRWSPKAIAAFAGVLVFALGAPITVSAEDELLTDEQVLAAEEPAPALAPAPPTPITTQVPSDVRWAPARAITPGSPLAASQATSPDYLPAALASGQREESAHLATVPLPGEDVEHGALADC
jgi:hypothetical protein